MWRFTLFRIPVEVQWPFWLIAVLLGPVYMLNTPRELSMLLIWVAIVFVSILWHELGHIFFQRRFGAWRSHIVLWGFGGLAIPDGGPGFTRMQSIIISAAGPAANLALAGGVWLLQRAYPPETWWQAFLVSTLIFINIAWAILNLLPILPLDGGHIFQHVSNGRLRLTGLVGFITAIVAGAIVIYLEYIHPRFVLGYPASFPVFYVLFFGYLAYHNHQVWRGYGAREPL